MCVARPFPFPLFLCYVEQMVLIPVVVLDAAEVSSLMPLLYHGNSLWSFWRREHTVDYCLLFMTFNILLDCISLCCSLPLPFPTCLKDLWSEPPSSLENIVFHYCCYISLHSCRHQPHIYLCKHSSVLIVFIYFLSGNAVSLHIKKVIQLFFVSV